MGFKGNDEFPFHNILYQFGYYEIYLHNVKVWDLKGTTSSL
jgi:elongation factor P hydroxylase